MKIHASTFIYTYLLLMIQIEHDEGTCIMFYIYLFAGYDTDRT